MSWCHRRATSRWNPRISDAVDLVAWADHLVFVFPTWWGTMPACLKGFLDRVLMPGFAFADREDGEGWDKLLVGKTAHLLTTMDTPPWVYRWIYRAPGLNALGRATLGFCGVEPVRSTIFGPVKTASAERRAEWIEEARHEGLALRHGALTTVQRVRGRLAAWLASFRLQFHPMAWAAYAIGAAGAWHATGHFSWLAFWLGLACLFSLELATVFTNDEFDFESDLRNRHHGPFTGGSRVLVDGSISFASMQVAVLVALGAFLASGLALATVVPPFPSLLILAALGVLALGYTVPPLKLCWRGLGEIDVGLTHSLGVILCGYAFQGGAMDERLALAGRGPAVLCHPAGHHAVGDSRLCGGSRRRQGHDRRPARSPRRRQARPGDDRRGRGDGGRAAAAN